MLLCITANHQNASFDLLEKLSIGAPEAAVSLVEQSPTIRGAVVLATCNRFETYLEVEGDSYASATSDTVRVISQASGIEPDALAAIVSVLDGKFAAEHLFAVSSGLESVVIGENEISGQVNHALDRARKLGTTSPGIERLFQNATRTSREVRGHTAIDGSARSLLRLGLDMAESRIAGWAQTRVLIVGTGQYAAAAAGALRARGVELLMVHSPSGRTPPFAVKNGIRVMTSLRDAIGQSDVVITCTTSQVVDLDAIPDSHPRLIVDLGLPRNVDPDLSGVRGIELLDLETIRLHVPLAELSAVPEARRMVRSAASQFLADQSVEPAIVAFRSHVFELLEAEITRVRARGDADGQIEAALRHLTGVLLHGPSVRAKDLARDGRAQEFTAALKVMFDLEPVPDPQQGEDRASA